MQNIYIGIDGGGTKTKVRVEDGAGNLIGQAKGGPANIRLSVDGAWQSILTTLDDILKSSQISLQDNRFQFHACMGLAGCEVVEATQEFLNYPHPFATLKLISDAHIACLGAHAAEDGAIIVIGTGVIGYQIENNKSSRVGGWGFPHSDEGSGAWLGLEAARLTFQWLDHRIEKSPLMEDVFAFFNQDFQHFSTWASRANSSEFARLAPLVINHAQQEEAQAVRLMKKAAHSIDRIAHTLEKMRTNHHKNDKPLPCCLFGGISPFIESWLDEELRSRIVAHKGDANTGAISLIREYVTSEHSSSRGLTAGSRDWSLYSYEQ